MERRKLAKIDKAMLSKHMATLFITILLVIFPLLINDRYILHLMITVFVWAIVATNWNMLLGYTGVFHYAQIALFAVGAYTSAIISLGGLSPWIGIIAAGCLTALFSIALGWPISKVKGIYLVLLTFAFHFVFLSSLFILRDFTGGSQGLVNVPPFSIGTRVFKPTEKVPYYYLALILLLISTFIHKSIIDSPIGTALQALRDSEKYAISRGVNPYKYKITVFVICSFLTGVCGGFYTHYLRHVGPAILSFENIITALAAIVIGGIGTIEGPIIGSFALIFMSEYLRGIERYRLVIKGLLLVIIIIVMPTGLVKPLRSITSFLSKKLKKKWSGRSV